jgi:phage shock protein PspC (stress-responsive transcriptional regulator)
MSKRLTKGDPFDSMVSGVCLGLSEYLGIDVTILRLIWIMLTFYHGIGLIPYIILAIIMPNKD